MAFAELSARLPEWGRLFDVSSYAAFLETVRAELAARGEPFELHDDHARIADAWVLPLLPLAQRCARVEAAEWAAAIREELDRRSAA